MNPNIKKMSRLRRARKTREKLKKLKAIRLVVHRTSKHIYAQVISSDSCTIIASACTLEKKIMNSKAGTGNKKSAAIIGKEIAKRALEKGIKKVSFDRSGFKYHGRVKELAVSARKTGLNF